MSTISFLLVILLVYIDGNDATVVDLRSFLKSTETVRVANREHGSQVIVGVSEKISEVDSAFEIFTLESNKRIIQFRLEFNGQEIDGVSGLHDGVSSAFAIAVSDIVYSSRYGTKTKQRGVVQVTKNPSWSASSIAEDQQILFVVCGHEAACTRIRRSDGRQLIKWYDKKTPFEIERPSENFDSIALGRWFDFEPMNDDVIVLTTLARAAADSQQYLFLESYDRRRLGNVRELLSYQLPLHFEHVCSLQMGEGRGFIFRDKRMQHGFSLARISASELRISDLCKSPLSVDLAGSELASVRHIEGLGLFGMMLKEGRRFFVELTDDDCHLVCESSRSKDEFPQGRNFEVLGSSRDSLTFVFW